MAPTSNELTASVATISERVAWCPERQRRPASLAVLEYWSILATADVESAIIKGMYSIIFSPTDSIAMAPALQQAVDANIPVITIDRAVEGVEGMLSHVCVLTNGLVLLNVSSFIQQIVIGVILVAAVAFDQFAVEKRQ